MQFSLSSSLLSAYSDHFTAPALYEAASQRQILNSDDKPQETAHISATGRKK